MFHKFFRHADSIVFYSENVVSPSVFEGGMLCDTEAYHPSRRRIFDGIPHQVDKNLVQL